MNEVVKKEAPKASEIQEWRDKYLRNYLIAGDFSKYPTYQKLAYLQITPRKFQKSRTIGGAKVPYVDHLYAEKCLNFAFNFRISSEILKEEFSQVKEGTKTVNLARVTVKFTFGAPGEEIVRTVISTHKGFQNPAVPDADALKSAVSKAWTIVARTFGIGADLKEPAEVLDKQQHTKPESTPAPKKSFEPETTVVSEVDIDDLADYFSNPPL